MALFDKDDPMRDSDDTTNLDDTSMDDTRTDETGLSDEADDTM
jgi:hypothetical protein